jgi:hypothetical protein
MPYNRRLPKFHKAAKGCSLLSRDFSRSVFILLTGNELVTVHRIRSSRSRRIRAATSDTSNRLL